MSSEAERIDVLEFVRPRMATLILEHPDRSESRIFYDPDVEMVDCQVAEEDFSYGFIKHSEVGLHCASATLKKATRCSVCESVFGDALYMWRTTVRINRLRNV